MKSKPSKLMAERHRRVMDALVKLEEHAMTMVDGSSEYSKRDGRARLAEAALVYAARVRTLAGAR